MKIQVGQRIEVFEALYSQQTILRGNWFLGYYHKFCTGKIIGVNRNTDALDHKGDRWLSDFFSLNLPGRADECRPVGAMIIKSIKK